MSALDTHVLVHRIRVLADDAEFGEAFGYSWAVDLESRPTATHGEFGEERGSIGLRRRGWPRIL